MIIIQTILKVTKLLSFNPVCNLEINFINLSPLDLILFGMKKFVNNSLHILLYVMVFSVVTLWGCKESSKEEAVREFAINFGEMVQNNDVKGIQAVYSGNEDVSNPHLKFYRDKVDIFVEGEDKYKVRYGDGAYIIVKTGLNNAMEVVDSKGIFESKGSKELITEVAPLHPNKKTTPAGLPNYDWLSTAYVTADDLRYKSGSDLRIMRNYIFARHGYKFKSKDLQDFFSQYSWYVPRYSDVSSSLNKIEKSNVETIKSWE